MCGIFGYSKLTGIIERALPGLAWEMEDRGTDSWGVTCGSNSYRELGPILDTFYTPDWSSAVYHTRMASKGAVTLDNQHPFEFSAANGGKIVGVHNGCLVNHDELNKKYNRTFAVDSMHVFAHLAEERSLKDIQGYGAFVWYKQDPSGVWTLHLARCNTGDLHVCRLETGEILFASTKFALEKAVRFAGGVGIKYYDLVPYIVYAIEQHPDKNDELIEQEKLEWGSNFIYGWNRHTSFQQSFCAVCMTDPCACEGEVYVPDTTTPFHYILGSTAPSAAGPVSVPVKESLTQETKELLVERLRNVLKINTNIQPGFPFNKYGTRLMDRADYLGGPRVLALEAAGISKELIKTREVNSWALSPEARAAYEDVKSKFWNSSTDHYGGRKRNKRLCVGCFVRMSKQEAKFPVCVECQGAFVASLIKNGVNACG